MFVRNWMSKPAVTISKDLSATAATELMTSKKVRRLPVVDGDRLVGIVTHSDLQASKKPGAPIRDLMASKPQTVSPDETLEQAAKLMLERKISGLPVVEDGRVTGIITESDVFRALAELLGLGEKGARVVFTVPEGADLLDAVKRKLSGLALQSLATFHHPERGEWEVVLRVRGRVKAGSR